MQAEAGQQLEKIVARKEVERRSGNGLFFWGVGNPPSAIVVTLARAGVAVPVIFSRMKSKPKTMDFAPRRIVVWRSYIDCEGVERPLPPHTLVTSRGDSATGVKKTHYALMCRSSEPLILRCRGEVFDPSIYRNAGGTGARVGFSQVTALLRRTEEVAHDSHYEVNIRAWLTGSYWVRLTDPIEITADKQNLLHHFDDSAGDWIELVGTMRSGSKAPWLVSHQPKLI